MTSASGPEHGQAHPSGMLPMATYTNRADEWFLLSPPAGAHPEMFRRAALAWRGSAPPPGGPVAFVPVRAVDPALGLSVLHYRPGSTTIYCGQDDLGTPAAETLSHIVGMSTPVLLTGADQHGPPRATVTSVAHGRWLHTSRDTWLHPSLHPVVAHLVLPQVTIYACDCQVTSTLADVLTVLTTEQLRLLHARRSHCGTAPPATTLIETNKHKS